MNRPIMIQFNAVSKYYGPAENPTYAIKNLSVEFPLGQTTCLIGPSGSGKTTLLKLINRLLSPDEGTILLHNKETALLPVTMLRRQMGYVIQEGGLFPHLSIEKNIGIMCQIEGWPLEKINKTVTELLNKVDLEPNEFAHRYPAELSGGQRQRVGIARSLALDPPIILMDEPFGALDPLTRQKLQNEFNGLRKTMGKTIVIVTHDINEAFLLGDQVVILNHGEIEQMDSPANLQAKPKNSFVKEFLQQHLS